MVSPGDTRSTGAPDLRGLHLIFRSGKVAFYWTFALELSLTRVERHYPHPVLLNYIATAFPYNFLTAADRYLEETYHPVTNTFEEPGPPAQRRDDRSRALASAYPGRGIRKRLGGKRAVSER